MFFSGPIMEFSRFGGKRHCKEPGDSDSGEEAGERPRRGGRAHGLRGREDGEAARAVDPSVGGKEEMGGGIRQAPGPFRSLPQRGVRSGLKMGRRAGAQEELRHSSTGSSMNASRCWTFRRAVRRAAPSSWSNSRLKSTKGIGV